jgi:hypothetical protein
MRSFLIAWVVAFCLVAVVATGVSWFVGSRPAVSSASPARNAVVEGDEAASVPFTEVDAVDVVSRRFPSTGSGGQLRRQLEGSATVSFHSARHWRVCYDSACWIAHGPGRYAEPENEAARQRELRAAHP